MYLPLWDSKYIRTFWDNWTY